MICNTDTKQNYLQFVNHSDLRKSFVQQQQEVVLWWPFQSIITERLQIKGRHVIPFQVAGETHTILHKLG